MGVGVEVVGGEVEEEVEVVFPLVVPPSSICHQTLVHPCIRGQDSIPCCPQEVWEVLEEGGHPTLDLACLHNNNMDKEDTPLIAPHYPEVEGPGVPLMVP